MNKFLIGLIIGLLIGAGGMYLLMKEKQVEVDVPVKIDVPVPIQDNDFEPIENPEPVKVDTFQLIIENPINKQLSNELDKANSIIDSLKTYKEFAVKRTYKETFEDSLQTITVNAETTGTLDKVGVSYVTKPYTIPLDTTIKTKIPQKGLLYLGGQIGVPTYNGPIQGEIGIAPGAIFVNKSREKAYTINYDVTNKRLLGGLYFNF